MCIVCLMVKAGMSDEARRLATALLSQMHQQNEVLKLFVENIPDVNNPALAELIRVGDALLKAMHTVLPEELTPAIDLMYPDVFPTNGTKH